MPGGRVGSLGRREPVAEDEEEEEEEEGGACAAGAARCWLLPWPWTVMYGD